MKNTSLSGVLLVAGAIGGVLVMLAHPTARDLMDAADPGRAAFRNVAVHSLALATLPSIFLGLLGLTRFLRASDHSVAALVLYGFGAVATVPAAVMSGFVATDLILETREGVSVLSDAGPELQRFTGLVNRGFYAVAVVASSLAILLWSWSLLADRRLGRAVAFVGLFGGAAIPIALLSGHLGLGLHGLAVVTLTQGAWLGWVGVLLVLRGPR